MRVYDLADFAAVPVVWAEPSAIEGADLSDIPHLPDIADDLIWTDALIEAVQNDAPEDRSHAIMEAAYLAAEEAWGDREILSLIYFIDDMLEKYTKRRNRDEVILDILSRARERVGYDGLDRSIPEGFLEKHNAAIMDEVEVLGFTDFVARDYPIDWILDGLLARGGAGLITGWPGAGKTTMALMLAADIALGTNFLQWKCLRPARVLFLSLEMSAPPLHLFVSEARKEYDAEELRQLNENLLLAPFGVPLHFDKAEGYERLMTLIEHHEPDLIIVDSLSMITPKDLTDEEAMKTLFDGLAVVRQETGVAFLVIHHNRKKAADAQRSKGAELSDIYGSTYITAKVDFAVNVMKMDEPNVVALSYLKNRLGKEPETQELIRKNMRFTDPEALTGFLGT